MHIYNFIEIKVWDDASWGISRKLKFHNKCNKVHYKTAGTKRLKKKEHLEHN